MIFMFIRNIKWKRFLPFRSVAGHRNVLVTLGLLIVAILASWVEYGYDYAKTVATVIIALGLHVWFFLLLLFLLLWLVQRRQMLLNIRIMVVLAIAIAAFHMLSPIPLGMVAGISAIIAVLIFGVMAISNRFNLV